MSCDRNSNVVMIRFRTKDLEAQLEVQPEDSVSNVGSRTLYTSGLSVPQIEYEEQLGTHRIMLDSQLEQLARDKAQAQLARDEAWAELKTQVEVSPFKNSHLTLLGCSCVGVAGQTIANIVADTPGLSKIQRIDMCLQRLSQCFGVRGGFFAEPEIRKYRYGAKLPSASAFALKNLKINCRSVYFMLERIISPINLKDGL